MSLELLLEQFDLVVKRAADVDALDAAILQLAVEGKLVPQDPHDEPACVLLERIEAEKQRLVEVGELSKLLKLPKIKSDECSFQLPGTWAWVRLGSVTTYAETARANTEEVTAGTWVLELADIEKGSSHLLQKVYYPERDFKSDKNVFKKGDVLYGKLRPYLDKVLVADEDGICTTEIIPFHGYYDIAPEYLRWILKSSYFINEANSKTYGMNLPRLGTKDAVRIPIPLPPLAEQKRIVARIDELRRQTAALRQHLSEAEAEVITVNSAALHGLHSAGNADEVDAAWQTIADAFDLLYDTPDNLPALRQTILQLAVQGKLVPRDPDDEPAGELLKRIEAEKQRLYEAGEIGKLPKVEKIKQK